MAGRVTVRRSSTGIGELVTLDSGVVSLTAAPALGGRLLSVALGGQEVLYRNPRLLDERLRPRPGVRPGPHDGPMSAWLNWGGDKTWPAPQGWDGPEQWAGPPDPVLDSGRYTCRVEGSEAASTTEGSGGTAADTPVTLVMTSGVEPRTGLRLERRVRLYPGWAGFTLELTMTNSSERHRRWALWNVTQLAGSPPGDDTSGGVYLGLAGSGRPATVGLVAGTGRPRVTTAEPGVLHVPHQDVVGKVGFPDAAGWLAHVGPGRTLTQRFAPMECPGDAGQPEGGGGSPGPGHPDGPPPGPDPAYPDGGARAEVWLEHPLDAPLEHLGGLLPRDRVVECEALGPLVDLAPGQFAGLRIDYGLGESAGPVTSVTEAGYWAGRPALRTGAGTTPTLTGTFVPFTAGRLEARRVGAGSAGPAVGGTPPAGRAPGVDRVDCGALEPGRALRFGMPVEWETVPGEWEFHVRTTAAEETVVGRFGIGEDT